MESAQPAIAEPIVDRIRDTREVRPLHQFWSIFGEVPNDVVVFVFSHISLTDFMNCMKVCRLWYLLCQDEVSWRHQTFQLLVGRYGQASAEMEEKERGEAENAVVLNRPDGKPEIMSWKEYFRETYNFGVWDVKVSCNRLQYSASKSVVMKTDEGGYADATTAFVGRPITSGYLNLAASSNILSKAYVEIRILSAADETFIGVTDNPSAVARILGADIISHRNIWVYCNGFRSTFYLGGRSVNLNQIGAHYRTNDDIGVHLDMDNHVVSFFKNKMLKGTFRLPPKKKAFQFFAMLDTTNDVYKINQSFWGDIDWKSGEFSRTVDVEAM